MKPLTYEDLAEIYKETTGLSAYVKPMSFITDWATSKPDLITYDEEADLFYRKVDK